MSYMVKPLCTNVRLANAIQQLSCSQVTKVVN